VGVPRKGPPIEVRNPRLEVRVLPHFLARVFSRKGEMVKKTFRGEIKTKGSGRLFPVQQRKEDMRSRVGADED